MPTAHEPLGVLASPGMVGGDVVGDVIEHEPDASVRQLLPRLCQCLRAAKGLVNDVAPHAIRRPDDVVGPHIGQGLAERLLQFLVGIGYSQARRAALPDAHQPYRVCPGRGDGVPIGGRDLSQGQPAAGRPRLLVEPNGRIDLVNNRSRRPPVHVIEPRRALWLATAVR